MQLANSELRYGTVAMTLHWLIALLIIGNLLGGFTLANVLDEHNGLLFPLIQIHKSIGLTVLVLSVARLLWRLVNRVPELPRAMSLPMRLLAHATHWIFYFLIIAIPFAGWAWASSSTRGIPTWYFWLFQWPDIPFLANLPTPDKVANGHLFHSLHIYFAYSAALLLVLHIGAALYHHFLRHDDVLRRMWFGTHVTKRA